MFLRGEYRKGMSGVICISSGSSSENEQGANVDYSESIKEAKKYYEKCPHSKILADTMKRLQSFADTVEQYHDEDERKEKEKEKETSEEEKEKKPKKNRGPKKKNLPPVTPISPIEPIEDSHISEDIHKDNCVKVVNEIFRFFDGKIPKIAIIIALHRNCGKVVDAMKSLQNGVIEEDPKVLVDINAAQGTARDKSNYFCN